MNKEFIIDNTLLLRQLRQEDASSLFTLLDANREHVGKWLPWVKQSTSSNDTLDFIKRSFVKFDETGAIECGIWEGEELVGVIGMRYVDVQNKRTELGYWLDEKHQGKGIMTKAVAKLITYAFKELQLHRIEIRAAVENNKSRAVPERLHFTMEGISREDAFCGDHFESHVNYSLLASEYEK